jgi:hypothetical protein
MCCEQDSYWNARELTALIEQEGMRPLRSPSQKLAGRAYRPGRTIGVIVVQTYQPVSG